MSMGDPISPLRTAPNQSDRDFVIPKWNGSVAVFDRDDVGGVEEDELVLAGRLRVDERGRASGNADNSSSALRALTSTSNFCSSTVRTVAMARVVEGFPLLRGPMRPIWQRLPQKLVRSRPLHRSRSPREIHGAGCVGTRRLRPNDPPGSALRDQAELSKDGNAVVEP